MGTQRSETSASGERMRRAACIASAGAAAIHLAATSPHLQEYRPAGTFMLACGIAQLAWAVAMMRRASEPLLLAGLIGNLSVVWLWTVSRTIGLPVGPEPWVAEHIDATDLLATALESVVVWAAAALLWPSLPRPGARLVALATTGTLLSVVVATHDVTRERAAAAATLLLIGAARAVLAGLARSPLTRPVWRRDAEVSIVRRRALGLDARPRAAVGARG